MLITAIQGQQAELAEELEERQQEVDRRADELLDELVQEINELQMRGSELQQLEHTRNPLHLLQVGYLKCNISFAVSTIFLRIVLVKKTICLPYFRVSHP